MAHALAAAEGVELPARGTGTRRRDRWPPHHDPNLSRSEKKITNDDR
jgi:hypothetical protein